MFKMIDTDNSGQITLEELKNGLERVGAILKDSEISGLMQAVSTILICTLRVFSILNLPPPPPPPPPPKVSIDYS
jgi:hypothetical protein